METLGLIEAQCWDAEWGALPLSFDWRTICRGRSPRGVANLLGIFMAILSPFVSISWDVLTLGTSPAIAHTACGGILLRRGDQGNGVKALQSALAARKYAIAIDGNFGSETERILKLFQGSNQLVTDGIYGEKTCQALTVPSNTTPANVPRPQPNPASTTDPNINQSPPDDGVLKQGEHSDKVRRLQEKLRMLCYGIPATGTFDNATKQAVLNFQTLKHLRADGMVGVETEAALNKALLEDDCLSTPPPTSSHPTTLPVTSNPNANYHSGDLYIVVIPNNPATTLSLVRQYVPDAFLLKSQQGEYVQAGAYGDRNNAESLSYALRANGLDARVVAD